jgi:hypothetical protein
MRNEHAGGQNLGRPDRQAMRVINNEELNSGTLWRQIESEIL